MRGTAHHPRRNFCLKQDFGLCHSEGQPAEFRGKTLAGLRSETFTRAVHRKGATIQDLELFPSVLPTRYVHINVFCDQEECLCEVVHNTAGRLGMPTGGDSSGSKPSERTWCAELPVRALREKLHVIVEDGRRTGVEVIFGPLCGAVGSATCRMDSAFHGEERCESQRWWHDQNQPP